jgi:hypothetical protein
MELSSYYLLFKLKKKSDYNMYIFFAFIFFIVIFSTFIAYFGSGKKKNIEEDKKLPENKKVLRSTTTPRRYKK